MMQSPLIGFLIVLRSLDANALETLNPAYLGVDRVSPYPTNIRAECEALDAYVFGGVKSDYTNMIPEYEIARNLIARLSTSPRSFELIWA